MKVTIISAVFPPEPVVSATTSMSIAETLQSRGDEVVVLAPFPNRPGARVFKGYKRNLYSHEQIGDNFKVIRCFATLSKELSVSSRFVENLTFGVTSSLRLLFLKKPDVIYANTWPILSAGLISIVAGLRRIPVVLSIQDLYPESLVAQGRMREDNLIIRLMYWLDRKIAQRAAEVIVISKRFAEVYINSRRIKRDRIHVIPNWIRHSEKVEMDPGGFRGSVDLTREEFVFLYGGNIGAASGVEHFIEAIKHTEGINHLIIAGEGSDLERCRKLASDEKRITIYSPWPKNETNKVLDSADVFLLPTAASQSLVSVPSKLISYMLHGKPILCIAHPESEIAEIIQASGCGWVVTPAEIGALSRKMDDISNLPIDELSRLGERGRNYALGIFSESVCVPKVIEILDWAAGFSQSC